MFKSTNKILIFASIPIIVMTFYLLSKINPTDTKRVNTSPSIRNYGKVPSVSSTPAGQAISISEDQQVIELIAKGGYSPSVVNAEANKETILRVVTDSTFDCSAALTIPDLQIRQNLPPSDVTEISLGSHPAGTNLAGTCSMGMYNFNVSFN